MATLAGSCWVLVGLGLVNQTTSQAEL